MTQRYDWMGLPIPEPLRSHNEQEMDKAVLRAQEQSAKQAEADRITRLSNAEPLRQLGQMKSKHADIIRALHPPKPEVGDE